MTQVCAPEARAAALCGSTLTTFAINNKHNKINDNFIKMKMAPAFLQ